MQRSVSADRAVVLAVDMESQVAQGLDRTGELMEQAQDKEKEGDVARERMQRNYSLLPKEMEALEESLEVSRPWTWFVAFAMLLVVELVRLSRWIGA